MLRRENPTYTYWRPGCRLQRGVVLKWFYSPSRRNTFVGGTCSLPSAILVLYKIVRWRLGAVQVTMALERRRESSHVSTLTDDHLPCVLYAATGVCVTHIWQPQWRDWPSQLKYFKRVRLFVCLSVCLSTRLVSDNLRISFIRWLWRFGGVIKEARADGLHYCYMAPGHHHHHHHHHQFIGSRPT